MPIEAYSVPECTSRLSFRSTTAVNFEISVDIGSVYRQIEAVLRGGSMKPKLRVS